MSSIIAELKEVSKEYQSGNSTLIALHPTTLKICRGELLLLMGASGSGKTTLLSLIGSVIYPTSGTVEINNIPTSALSQNELAKLRLNNIGFIFQNYNLIAPLTAIQNVQLPLSILQVAKKKSFDLAIAALSKLKMESRKDALPKQLSGGEQQRVAIARALVTNPDIILCDEPTGALDKASSLLVMTELRKLATEGKCVVVVTHDTRLENYADRIIYLENGYTSDKPFPLDMNS